MSINSKMKKYDIFFIKNEKNKLKEDIKSLEFFKSSLISIHNKVVNYVDINNVYTSRLMLTGITRDLDIKENMILKIDDKTFNIKNIKNSKRILSFKLEEVFI